MLSIYSRCVLFSVLVLEAFAAKPCPIHGPVFPPPKNLTSSKLFQESLVTLNKAISNAFSTGNSTHGPVSSNDTNSIQIFSIAGDTPLFEYYNKGANLVNGDVNGESVFRIGSITKLYTVYLLLIEAGDQVFNERVTKYLPELEGQQHWNEVTIGVLAGHMGGIAADIFNWDFTTDLGGPFPFPQGAFPPLSSDEESPCISNITHCTRDEFIKALLTRDFNYLPSTTPVYSNSAFVLLGYILETITGKTFNQVLSRSLSGPVGLPHTFATAPSDSSIGAIIYNETYSGWDIDISEATAMGGIYASANDVAAVGRSILSARLLPSNTTHAWMKPTTFTSSPFGAVGRPWEIFRASLPSTGNHVVDLYTKAGSVGVYTSIIVLVPEFNVGWTVLIATELGNYPWTMSGIIADILLPALQEAAREEADTVYSGTYSAPHYSGINSTVTLSTTPGQPGLGITRWISNGTDLLSLLVRPGDEFRMYPSNIAAKDGEVNWKAVAGSNVPYEDAGPFSACIAWMRVDRPAWGVWGIGGFTFLLSGGGKAESVENKALKILLEKERETTGMTQEPISFI